MDAWESFYHSLQYGPDDQDIWARLEKNFSLEDIGKAIQRNEIIRNMLNEFNANELLIRLMFKHSRQITNNLSMALDLVPSLRSLSPEDQLEVVEFMAWLNRAYPL